MPTELPRFTPQQAHSASEAGMLLIDLRRYEDFAAHHIPRSISVAFSRKSLPERIATASPPRSPIILLSEDKQIIDAAAAALTTQDRNPLRGTMNADIQAWRSAGIPLVQLAQITVQTLWQRLNRVGDIPTLIDVREPFEWDLGYIDGSLLISLGEIWQRAESLDPRKDIILICQEGLRSTTAASILLHHKFPRVGNVAGGIGNWLDTDYPTVRPRKR